MIMTGPSIELMEQAEILIFHTTMGHFKIKDTSQENQHIQILYQANILETSTLQ
jgi:hypothetical protein